MGHNDDAKDYGQKSLSAADEANDDIWQLNATVLIAQAEGGCVCIMEQLHLYMCTMYPSVRQYEPRTLPLRSVSFIYLIRIISKWIVHVLQNKGFPCVCYLRMPHIGGAGQGITV